MTQPNQQAFPCTDLNFYDEKLIGGRALPGLTKREYFAAIALQAILSSPKDHLPADSAPAKYFPALAVVYAEALIAELDRTK